jgi:serine/threonine-protein kinase
MASAKTKKIWLIIGIGFGIVFISAFVTSQIIFPIIFRSPKNVEVPDVVGMSLAKARQQLSGLGLHAVVRDSIWSDTDKVDIILEQDPAPGKKISKESSIYFRISRGTKEVGVPSVIGLSYHEAYYTLRSAGLQDMVADSLYSDSYRVNTVIRCSPTVGSKVDKGSSVRIYLSRGPEPLTGDLYEHGDSTFTREPPYNY